MNSMKREKGRKLKDELPRSVVPNMLLEKSGEITPEKNEKMKPKWKQHQVVDMTLIDVTHDGNKVQRCKEQYCTRTWNVRSINQGKLEAVRQEIARVNIDILGISENENGLEWVNLIQMTIISTNMCKNPLEERE